MVCVKKLSEQTEANLFENNILLYAVNYYSQCRMMFRDNQQVNAKEALCDLTFMIHGFIEDQENDEFALVSLSSTNFDDAN